MLRATLAALTMLGLAAGAFAQEGSTSTGSRLTIRGGSTLRAWSCATENVAATVRTTTGAGDAVAGLPAGRHRVSVTIPVRSIDCRNGTMNGHLREALRAERQPEITFELQSYSMTATGVVATGSVTVGGRTSPIEIQSALAPAADGIRVTGQVPLRMTQLGVEPPTLMLGTLRVRDEITIDFDVFIARDGLVALR